MITIIEWILSSLLGTVITVLLFGMVFGLVAPDGIGKAHRERKASRRRQRCEQNIWRIERELGMEPSVSWWDDKPYPALPEERPRPCSTCGAHHDVGSYCQYRKEPVHPSGLDKAGRERVLAQIDALDRQIKESEAKYRAVEESQRHAARWHDMSGVGLPAPEVPGKFYYPGLQGGGFGHHYTHSVDSHRTCVCVVCCHERAYRASPGEDRRRACEDIALREAWDKEHGAVRAVGQWTASEIAAAKQILSGFSVPPAITGEPEMRRAWEEQFLKEWESGVRAVGPWPPDPEYKLK